MREVKAVTITKEEFAPYGTFYDMTHPDGYPLQGEIHKFYPDRISGTAMGSMAFSPIEVKKGRSDRKMCRVSHNHLGRYRSAGRRYDHPRSPCIRRNPCPTARKSIPRTKRFHGKDQCCNLALMPSAGKQ